MLKLSMACALLASAMASAQPVGSVQQDRQPTWQATQAATAVPPVAYQSVFDGLPKGVESTALDWKAANANVGQFRRGHADLLKWEQEQVEKARKAPKAESSRAVPPQPQAGGKP